MIVYQPFESTLLGVGDNYVVLSGVLGYVDCRFTVRGVETKVYNFRYTAYNGIVDVNIREITRLVYDNLKFYQDPFDYSGDVLYTELDAYHFIKLDILFTDGNLDTISINDISIINAALDVGECLLLSSLEDEILNEEAGKGSSQSPYEFNYDLNLNLS